MDPPPHTQASGVNIPNVAAPDENEPRELDHVPCALATIYHGVERHGHVRVAVVATEVVLQMRMTTHGSHTLATCDSCRAKHENCNLSERGCKIEPFICDIHLILSGQHGPVTTSNDGDAMAL